MAGTRLAPDSAVREMLFKLMTLARDVSFADTQIRSICETVTPANVQHTIDLLRRLNTNSHKGKPTVSAPPTRAAVTKPTTPGSAESGAVICADIFQRLYNDDVKELMKLTNVCPFSLASQQCPHSTTCQLLRVCWVSHISFSSPESTANSLCSIKTTNATAKRIVKALTIRLFMSAMCKPHELGFYGFTSSPTVLQISAIKQQQTHPTAVCCEVVDDKDDDEGTLGDSDSSGNDTDSITD
ncbi:hypothetical protein E4T47_01045 [Aureobasidium subglaciale]|nr:hypothetical protein E4T47_01045 [Aureobasidium subglaciale]